MNLPFTWFRNHQFCTDQLRSLSYRQISLLLIGLLSTLTSYAQTTYPESPDFPGTDGASTYRLKKAGDYIFSGHIQTPDDQQDAFKIIISKGFKITSVVLKASGGKSIQQPTGFVSFADGYDGHSAARFNDDSGVNTTQKGDLGPNSATNPYIGLASVDYSVGTTWSIKVTVEGNGETPSTPEPEFTQQPASTAVCEFSTATFTASASDADSYQWQESSDASFTSPTTLSSDGNYAINSTSTGGSTLTINKTTMGLNGKYYRAVAMGDGGTTNSNGARLTVNALPMPTITNLASAYCKNAAAVPLTGSPSGTGGSFKIDATTATQFDPATLSAGSHTVYYTYTDGNGCNLTTFKQVTVNALPMVSITNLASAYCKDAVAVPLTGTPSGTGGSFKIDGTTATQFNPATLSAGSHTVLFSFTDGNSCTNSISKQVTVNALPVVSIPGLNDAYCKDAAAVPLTGTPSGTGGSFKIDGTTATQFNPANLTVGMHTVRFTYTDGNGCTNSISKQVTVNALPVPMLSNNGPLSSNNSVTLTATGGSSYLFSQGATQGTGANSNTATVVTSGTFSVTAISNEGCRASTNTTVLGANSPTVCRGGQASISLSAPGSPTKYEWYQQTPYGFPLYNNSLYQGTNTATLIITNSQQDNVYYTKVYYADGSSTIYGPSRLTINRGCRVGASVEPGTELRLTLLGNPIRGEALKAVVEGAGGQSLRVELLDLKGQSVRWQNWDAAEGQQIIDWNLNNATSGVYLLQAVSGQQRQSTKVVKP